ncbi:hypothetical protein VTK73DRAFT_5810 [Phialemonium thermophilum]|uniref:T6SS Phospholipase effector Tle1-like catalytic domain-containing protein n=1 Tax=Phialemonium thermophilum TaxID=223376 RepID=A0ABR3V0K7_9PEZI
MVASVGLLTPAGMASFQAVFDDYENMGEPGRDPADYLVPGLPAYGGEKGERKQRWEAERMRRYKLGLKQLGYTRDTFRDGRTEIRIRALAVWDTVGSLGIPPAPVVGIRGSADQYVSPSLRALLLM